MKIRPMFGPARALIAHSSICLLLCALEASMAQQAALTGSVGFVNTIDSPEPSFFLVNGESYRIPGYKLGEMALGPVFPERITEFRVENAKFGQASASIDVNRVTPVILIAYVAKEDERDPASKLVAKMKTLPSQPSKSLDVVGLYVTAKSQPAQVFLNGKVVMLPPWKIVNLTQKAPYTFQSGSKGRVLNMSGQLFGRVIMIVYDRADGSLAETVYEDSPFYE